MKKILCLLFAVLMTLSFVACDTGNGGNDSSEPVGTQVDSSLKDGEIAPVGDVFELPDVKQATGAPIIGQVTKQAYPGDSVMVAGAGFKGAGLKFYVYAQTEKGNGKAKEAKYTVVDDSYASVLIDPEFEYGMYGIYAENASGTSAIKTINKPVIWEIGLYKLTAGENLTILGENLTTDNGDKTSVYLVSEDGKQYCEVSVLFADAGKVEIKIPEGLTAGAKYKVKIHNGHGGQEGFAESEDFVEYLDNKAVSFDGKVLNIVDYGADPNSRTNDDSKAFNKAFREAQAGDTIYFPPGSYLFTSTVTVSKGIRIIGAGADNTTIFAGYNVSGGIFNISAGPCEITGIRFEQKRTKGKLKGYFIDLTTDSRDSGRYNLYFHHNEVIQSVTSKSRSSNYPIRIIGSYGIVIENNYFDATGMVYVANANKVYLRNNEAIMNIYCGVYYQVCNTLFTNTKFLDISNNKVTGGGAPKDGPGALKNDELTAGRVFGVQGSGENIYISHNTIRRAGIPNTNAGELILFENLTYRYDGMVESSDEYFTNLLKSDKNKITVGNVISIVSGKGKGQYRQVVQRSKLKVKVDKPWDVVPDATSRVIINNGYLNSYVCHNDMDGHTNWAEIPSATTGLQGYGAIHNMFYCQNNIKNVTTGFDITPHYYNNFETGQESDAKCVIAWNIFDRNTVDNAGRGSTMAISTSGVNPSDPNPAEIAFGNTFRKNVYKNMKDYIRSDRAGTGGLGIRMGQSSSKWPGDWCVGNLYEANEFSNCAIADIIFYSNQANNVFRNNTNGDKKAGMNVTDPKLGPIEATY